MSSSYCKNFLRPGRSQKCAIVPIKESHVIKVFGIAVLLIKLIQAWLIIMQNAAMQQSIVVIKTAIEPMKAIYRAKNINSPQILRQRMTSEHRLEIFIQRAISLHKVSQSCVFSCSSFRIDWPNLMLYSAESHRDVWQISTTKQSTRKKEHTKGRTIHEQYSWGI